MAKRGNIEVFSPEMRDTQRQRIDSSMMENKVLPPALAILDTSVSDKTFDIASLKAKSPCYSHYPNSI